MTLKSLKSLMQFDVDSEKFGAKFEEKMTHGSKNDMRNLVNFNASSSKSENLLFDVLLLSKVHYFWAQNVQKIYVS